MLERIISASRRGIVNAALGLSLALGGAYAASGCEGDTTINYNGGTDADSGRETGTSGEEGFCHKLWEKCPGKTFLMMDAETRSETILYSAEDCSAFCDENSFPIGKDHPECVRVACEAEHSCCEEDECGRPTDCIHKAYAELNRFYGR